MSAAISVTFVPTGKRYRVTVKPHAGGHSALSDVTVSTLKKNMISLVKLVPEAQDVFLKLSTGSEVLLEDHVYIPLDAALLIAPHSIAHRPDVGHDHSDDGESDWVVGQGLMRGHHERTALSTHLSSASSRLDSKVESIAASQQQQTTASSSRPPLPASNPTVVPSSALRFASRAQEELLAMAKNIFHKESNLAFSPSLPLAASPQRPVHSASISPPRGGPDGNQANLPSYPSFLSSGRDDPSCNQSHTTVAAAPGRGSSGDAQQQQQKYDELLALKDQLEKEVEALRIERSRSEEPAQQQQHNAGSSSLDHRAAFSPHQRQPHSVALSHTMSRNVEAVVATKTKVQALRSAMEAEDKKWASVKQQLEQQISDKKNSRLAALEQQLGEEEKVKASLLSELDAIVYKKERMESVLREVDRLADLEKQKVDAATRDLDECRDALLGLLKGSPMHTTPDIDKKDADLAQFIAATSAQKHKQQLLSASLVRQREALTSELNALSDQRRSLHNDVEEAKGNIRVIVRMRPKLQSEEEDAAAGRFGGTGAGGGGSLSGLLEEGTLEVDHEHHTVTAITPTSGTRSFEFFAVYGPPSTDGSEVASSSSASLAQQGEIFHEQVVPLLHSLFDGYNVAVLAYGQTGSGKTFTILGETEDGQLSGLLPQSVEYVLDSMHQNSSPAPLSVSSNTTESPSDHPPKRRVTFVSMSMVELYLDAVYDLLSVVINGVAKKCEIGGSAVDGPVVVGATEVELGDWAQAMHFIRQAIRIRQTHKTLKNAKSSRSFLLLTLTVTTSPPSHTSKLLFVDLAGSERVSRSLSDGDRLREAQHINKSLAAVGDVMCALSSSPRPAHIPYRNSKLTQLLQNALGGRAKTLLVTCICPHIPSQHNLVETMSTLQFASRTKLVRNVVAKRQKEKIARQQQTGGLTAPQRSYQQQDERKPLHKASPGGIRVVVPPSNSIRVVHHDANSLELSDTSISEKQIRHGSSIGRSITQPQSIVQVDGEGEVGLGRGEKALQERMTYVC